MSPPSVCTKCENACPTCWRCEIPYEDARDMVTTQAPGDIIVGCTMFKMRVHNEEEIDSQDVGEGVYDNQRNVLPNGMHKFVIEWEEVEEEGYVRIRTRIRGTDSGGTETEETE